jgi:hypothetical protein
MRSFYTALDFTNNQVLLAQTAGSPGIGDDSTKRENGKSFEACLIIFGGVTAAVSFTIFLIYVFCKRYLEKKAMVKDLDYEPIVEEVKESFTGNDLLTA